jgi:hypothetical protein
MKAPGGLISVKSLLKGWVDGDDVTKKRKKK